MGHPVPWPILVGVWIGLMILTVITVAVTYVDLGALNIIIAMGVATMKASLVVAFFMHLFWDKPLNSITFLFSILFQVYPTTLLGYAVWNGLLNKYPVSTVAPLTLFVPVFGMLGSVLIFGESLPGYKWLAMACILMGLLINRFGSGWWRQWQGPLRA